MEQLKIVNNTLPGQPLWKRVPTRDTEGKALSDFMMLIPGLKKADTRRQQEIYHLLNRVFSNYGKAVVYVDLNIKLDLLWVSIKPIPGICIEMAQVIRHVIPEALLIAGDNDVLHRHRMSRSRLTY